MEKTSEVKRSLVDCLATIQDPRVDRTKEHKLIDVLVIAVCAVICGAEGWTDCEDFGQCKEKWFRTFLELENGIPSHDTFNRVFRLLDPKRFEDAFRRWTAGMVNAVGGTLAADGKAVRDSRDGKRSPIHLVSAFATEAGLALGLVLKWKWIDS